MRADDSPGHEATQVRIGAAVSTVLIDCGLTRSLGVGPDRDKRGPIIPVRTLGHRGDRPLLKQKESAVSEFLPVLVEGVSSSCP